MPNLFVSYDLYKQGQDYSKLTTAIQSLGIATKVHLSLWYLKTNLTADNVLARLKLSVDTNDKILVIDASGVIWNALAPVSAKVMQDNWNR